jgi:hypothetical protein
MFDVLEASEVTLCLRYVYVMHASVLGVFVWYCSACCLCARLALLACAVGFVRLCAAHEINARMRLAPAG